MENYFKNKAKILKEYSIKHQKQINKENEYLFSMLYFVEYVLENCFFLINQKRNSLKFNLKYKVIDEYIRKLEYHVTETTFNEDRGDRIIDYKLTIEFLSIHEKKYYNTIIELSNEYIINKATKYFDFEKQNNVTLKTIIENLFIDFVTIQRDENNIL